MNSDRDRQQTGNENDGRSVSSSVDASDLVISTKHDGDHGGQDSPSSGRSPRSQPATPLSEAERDTISRNLASIRREVTAATDRPRTRPATAADLKALVQAMHEQEDEIGNILNKRGFPPLPPVTIEEAPEGADEDAKQMYMTRNVAQLDEHMHEIERRLAFDADGNVAANSHMFELEKTWEPQPDEENGTDSYLTNIGLYMRQYIGMTKEEEVMDTENIHNHRSPWGISLFGVLLQLLYLSACGFYIYVRLWYTLPPLAGHRWYGIMVLVVEIIGMVSVNLFTVTLMFKGRVEGISEHRYKRSYHIRVLIPCYKESLSIIKQTIIAARNAELPEGCQRTIYLCDDGKDPKKREWILTMDDPQMVYVTGRKRRKGETNGKSGNLNNCLKLVYPKDLAIGFGEVMCLFDADQVCSRSFFVKMLPLIDSGENVAIALSPQCVYNIKPGQDIFNRSNVQFWEVMLPGYDALGFISCTGTNMLIRCRALRQCGWFPTTTVTEDWELGMWMKKYGWICRYMPEYLAVGEAPLEVRQAFQQRSRWCKGHFQTFFSRACPALDSKLSLPMRILYSGTVISYFSTGVSVPLFSLVPVIAIGWGVFPLALNFWAVVGITAFYGSTVLVLFNATNLRRLMALYFVQVSNYILWWTYLKGAVLTPIKMLSGQGFSFKATNKGAHTGFDFPVRDLFMPSLIAIISLAFAILGLASLDIQVSAPIALSICWCIWNSLPGLLLLAYTFLGQGRTMRVLCLATFILSWVVSCLAIVLLWFLYPRDYDQDELLQNTMRFLDAQRSGPIDEAVGPAWRQSSLTQLTALANYTAYDMAGGFYSGGLGGNSKLVTNIAFSTAMLSWAVKSYTETFRHAKALPHALAHVNEGAVYLMKAHVYRPDSPGETLFFPQAGNLTREFHSHWERPEDLDARLRAMGRDSHAAAAAYPVPSFTAQQANHSSVELLNGAGVGDLAAQMSAALTAASLTLGAYPRYADNAATFLARGIELLQLSLQYPGLYTQMPTLAQDYHNARISSSSYKDDQAWAAAWLYKAAKQRSPGAPNDPDSLLKLVTRLYGEAAKEWREEGTWVSQDRILRAVTVMMGIEARQGVYGGEATRFLTDFICANEPIDVTRKDRLWHPKASSLGENALVAFLLAEYGEKAPSLPKRHRRSYRCKAMSQLRYLMGDRGPGYIAGFGPRPPTHLQHEGAACPAYPAECPPTVKFAGEKDNNVLYGALVEGRRERTDTFKDERQEDSARVSLTNNAALPGLAAFAADTDIYWMECLQYGGVFSKHPMC